MSNTLPCTEASTNPDGSYFCDNSYDPSDGVTGNQTFTYNPSTEQSNFEWKINSWAYLAIGRYDSSDTEICTYTLKTTVSHCDADVGVFIGGGLGTICIPYVNASVLAPIALTGLPSVAAFFGAVQVPQNTAYLHGFVNSTSANLVFHGASYGTPTFDRYHCVTGYPTPDGATHYIYDLQCYTPRVGEFFFSLNNIAQTPESYDMTLQLTFKTCAAGFAGWNCTDVISKWLPANSGVPVVVPPQSYRYYYLDFDAGQGEGISLDVTVNQSSVFLVRPLGFPYDLYQADDGRGYEESDQRVRIDETDVGHKVITAEDTYTGGRWYWAISIDNDTPLSFTINANVTQDTNVIGTSDNSNLTAGEESQTGDDSSNFALVCVPSALIAAILAFLASLF